MKYSKADLEQFKELILEKRKAVVEEITTYSKALSEGGTQYDSGFDFGEQSLMNAEMELMSQMAMRQKKYLSQLDDALARIEFGNYGVCRVSGELIEKARLLAVPTTTLSIAAKMSKDVESKPGLGKKQHPVRRFQSKMDSKRHIMKPKDDGVSYDMNEEQDPEDETPFIDLDNLSDEDTRLV